MEQNIGISIVAILRVLFYWYIIRHIINRI